jgi:hypothetical protein
MTRTPATSGAPGRRKLSGKHLVFGEGDAGGLLEPSEWHLIGNIARTGRVA